MTIKERMQERQAFNPFLCESRIRSLQMSNTISKKRRVMDYLASGKTLTANEARSRFGVGNMRATISNIKSQVEAYGNWSVSTCPSPTGKTRYGMKFHGYTDNPFAQRAGIV